jgi:hypothetical protein
MTLSRILAFCLTHFFCVTHPVINQIARLYHPEKKQVVTLIGDYHEDSDFTSDLPAAISHKIILDNAYKTNQFLIDYLNKNKMVDVYIECFNEEEVFQDKKEIIRYFQTGVKKNPISLCGISSAIPQKCKKPSRIHKADSRGYIGILHSISTLVSEVIAHSSTTGLLLKGLNKLETEPFVSLSALDVLQELEKSLALLSTHQQTIDKQIATAATTGNSPQISENIALLIAETSKLLQDFKILCTDHKIDPTKPFITHIKQAYLELLKLEIKCAKAEEDPKEISTQKNHLESLLEQLLRIASSGNLILMSQGMDNSIAASILSSAQEEILVASGYIHSKNIQDILQACGYQLADESKQIQSSWSAHDELGLFKKTGASLFSQKDKVRQTLVYSDDFNDWLCQKVAIKAATQESSFKDGDFKE